MVYAISKLVFWPVLSLFIKKIEGIENLPRKPFILVSNHSSYIDGVILIFLVAWHRNLQLCSFATNQKFLGPIWNALFNHFGAIRVNGAMEKAVKALKEDKCVGIFPEGQRTYTGGVQKVTHTGLGVLALLSKAPVVPVALNTWHFWNRYETLPNFKKNIKITIGTPMSFKLKATKQNFKKVNNSVMKEVKKLARISHA
jgi:1-acyl-sn-glycerol-3-phosphate acyltransferase